MRSRDPPFGPSQVSLRTVFTVCLGVVLVAAVVLVLARTMVALLLTVGGAMAAVALDHLVLALTRRGLSRSLALVAVIAGLGFLLLGLGLLLVPPIVSQAKALVGEAPALWRKILQSPTFAALDARLDLEEQLRAAGPAAAGVVTPIVSALGGIATAVGGLLAFLFLAVFMLLFGRDLVAAFLAELRPPLRERYQRVAAKVYRSVGGYLGGLFAICGVNAVATTLFLVVMRMPFFLPLGVLSGTTSLVPYAGPLLGGATITFLVLVTVGPWKALAAGIYFVLYGQLEGNLLAPLVYRRTVHVNPLVTLLAVLFLAEMMGVAGAILAVPAAAAAQIVIRELLSTRRGPAAGTEGGGEP